LLVDPTENALGLNDTVFGFPELQATFEGIVGAGPLLENSSLRAQATLASRFSTIPE